MNKKLITALAFILCSSLMLTTACDSNNKDNSLKIGILQLVEHPALDSARLGFIDGLKEAGYTEGNNISISTLNAQADPSNLKTMSQKLVEEKSDVILAIATPTAQSLAAETKTIPIVITAVTDPAAADLVKSNEKPETNITGTSDMTPVAKQFDLIKRILPDAKTIGIIYSSSEINSEIQVEVAKQCAVDLGLEIITSTVASANDVAQVVESLVGKVDAIYAPTDNIVASSIPIMVKITNANNIPIISGEEGPVAGGALITDGVNYYDLGKQTADMAIKIIKGESKPQDMAIQYLENTSIVVNKTTADILGITIPDDILQKAKIVE